MAERIRRSLIQVLGVILIPILGLSGPSGYAMNQQVAAGVIRFGLDTGEPAKVVGQAAQLKGESAEYLRARLLLNSGEVDQARERFSAVFEGHAHRGESALRLAELALAMGDTDGAEHWFSEARRTGFGDVAQRALLGLAELARGKGERDAAGQYLARLDDGYRAAVGYMNLAADFAREDLDSSRALVSLRVAMAMASRDDNSVRAQALLDQLNLRAGFLTLNAGDHDKAIDFLEKVSLQGYHTPQALYFHGLALSGKGNHRAAMQSWHRAKKFPLAFPGVAEAWIGMGRGYDLSGYPGQAGESWLAANAAYESERVTLDKLADQIGHDGAFKTLVRDARVDEIQWFLADSRTLTQPRMAYLLRFMEAPDAQAAVRRVARLDELLVTLEESESDLDVFIDMMQVFGQRSDRDIAGIRSGGIQEVQAGLEAQLAGLVTKAQAAGQKAALEDLQWSLRVSGQRIAGWRSRMPEYPALIDSARQEASVHQGAIMGLRQRARALRKEAARELDDLALAFVDDQRERMSRVLNKTEQQIAHLYEYLALETLEGGAQ